MTRYLLDANVFIEGKNHYYGMDFCPGFWDWLIAQQGRVFSIKAVYDELAQNAGEEDEGEEDELSVWVKGDGHGLFLPHDQAMTNHLAVVATWASNCPRAYSDLALSTFNSCADLYVVAYAMAHGCTVVTREISSPSSNKLKVPDACIGVGVKCIQPFEMLRAEGARFVLQPPSGGGFSGIDVLRH